MPRGLCPMLRGKLVSEVHPTPRARLRAVPPGARSGSRRRYGSSRGARRVLARLDSGAVRFSERPPCQRKIRKDACYELSYVPCAEQKLMGNDVNVRRRLANRIAALNVKQQPGTRERRQLVVVHSGWRMEYRQGTGFAFRVPAAAAAHLQGKRVSLTTRKPTHTVRKARAIEMSTFHFSSFIRFPVRTSNAMLPPIRSVTDNLGTIPTVHSVPLLTLLSNL
jgi:hypothetical protein